MLDRATTWIRRVLGSALLCLCVCVCVTYRLCAEDGLAAGFCAHAGEWAEGVVGEDVDSLDYARAV